MNSKVKGNIRPGEEQLGDGIVRPSADLTARTFHSAAHTCDRNGPTLVIRTPDSSISIKSLSVPVLEPKWFLKGTFGSPHDGPLVLDFYVDGRLKRKSGNERCWYRETSYYSLHNLFTFVTRGWQPGDPKRHMLRNWRRDKKDWGGNMGEEKINNATAP